MKIKEIIVVEGKNDIHRLNQVIDAEMISVSGQGINEDIFKTLESLNKKRGLIVLMDPDHQGDKIRALINERIPGLKNAFVDKKDCRTKDDIGIEHATDQSILKALESMITYDQKSVDNVTMQTMVKLKLAGNNQAKENRKFVSEYFNIGWCNAKTMMKRLNMLNITENQLESVVEKLYE